MIHTGSRNLGKQVAEYYQHQAEIWMDQKSRDRSSLINQLKAEGREKEIEATIKAIPTLKVPKELAYLEGKLMEDYLHDMDIVQFYAHLNRAAIMYSISEGMGWKVGDGFNTIHNYIDLDNMILRKGAVSAMNEEKLLIPVNMRDGSLICKGKGNPDWNYSAPHGAGRLMSRSAAKEKLSLEEYSATMSGIWSTSVSQATLDEAPMAYKPIENLLENIADTVEVIDIIKPCYNFKAS